MSIFTWLLSRGLADLSTSPVGWPGWALPAVLALGGDLWMPASFSLLMLALLSPSFQHVYRWQLRHRQQQRCPAEPAVLLAPRHGGDPQPHSGECLSGSHCF